MDKIFRQVKSHERSPEKNGTYHTNRCLLTFENNGAVWTDGAGKIEKPHYWYEEITLESIQDKRELTATFLVNSIRLLDEQGARHLVKELCERFHLLPTGEDINYKFPLNANEPHKTTLNVGCRTGANYILKALKGEKR